MPKSSDTEAQDLRLVWLAPWFAGLDSQILRHIALVNPNVTVTLIGTAAGLSAVAEDVPAVLLAQLWRSRPQGRAWLRAARAARASSLALLDDTWDPRFCLLWFLARRRALVVHDVVAHDADNEHAKHWQRWLKQWVRQRARTVICYSEFVKQQVHRSDNFPRVERVDVVPLPPEVETQSGVAEQPRARGARNFLLVGRISPYKNVPAVVDAWKDYKRAVGDNGDRLILAGAGAARYQEPDGPLESSLVYVDRPLTAHELVELVASATAVIVYYQRATQSGILSLAASLGTPSIVSAVGGLPEYQPDENLVARDRRGLVEAMRYVADHEEVIRPVVVEWYRNNCAPTVTARRLMSVMVALCK